MPGSGQNDRDDAALEPVSSEADPSSDALQSGGAPAEGEVRPDATEPEAAEPPPDESKPADDAPQLSEADKEKLRKETEIESLLGPNVRTPVGIPRDYRPMDASLHDLFHVEMEDFAGPMDLLLYLIRKHEIDVFDIPITFIADRYVELIDVLKALEIDVAAEFLVLAADLVLIKSKMLLPAKEGEAVDDDDPDAEEDPREELVRRLLEYQKYRDAAEQLKDRDQLGRDVFARVPPDLDAVDDLDRGLKTVSIFKLVEVMAKLMRRTPVVAHAIEFETHSITERIRYVMGFCEAREGRATLVNLLEGIMTRGELVVTFIAVLEMTKLGLAKILADEEHPADHPMMPPHDHQVEDWQDGLRPVAAPEAEEIDHALHPELDEDEQPDEEAPEPASDDASAPPADAHAPSEADGALQETMRLAEELDALEASMEAEQQQEEAREEARQKAALARADAEPWQEDALPTIYVVLTGKKFEGDILDDYR